MTEEQKPTQETHPDSSQLNASGGNEAVTETAVDPLAIINEATGRDYKDLQTAVSSIKEMQKEASSVGNLKTQIENLKSAPKTDEELREQVAQLSNQLSQTATDTFFVQNPDHAANRTLLEKIAKADGISIADAINSESYKAVYDALRTAADVQSKRTVVEPNNRVSQPRPDEAPAPGDKKAAGQYVYDKFFKS